MKIPMALAAALLLMGQAPAAPAPDMKLWRLDCGSLDVSDFGAFSDAYRFDGQPRKIVDSCYLVKHGTDYLLWDTGLTGDLEGKSETEEIFTSSVRERIVKQLARIGVKPEAVTHVGISHYHNDHTGQAVDFPRARLLIGAQDLEVIRTAPPERIDRARFKPWLEGGAPLEAVRGDKDVFGDGKVVMLAMPGHTPGHHVLLVRLPKRGPVLLSGDQFHSTVNFDEEEVPSFNTNRADTLASFDRFKKIARNLKALVIIQHEAADVGKLPAFPAAAE